MTAGRPDLQDYRALVINSSPDANGDELEAGLEVACELLRRRHRTLVDYLAGGGQPGRESRSPRYRTAEATFSGALSVLASQFGRHYPKSDRPHPVTEVAELIQHRVGPMCTGWKRGDALHHHPELGCPVHADGADTVVSEGESTVSDHVPPLRTMRKGGRQTV